MKFIKLELLNLASLDREEGEIINFEEGALGNSTIFSIVGATGSGKSTILDAICLALYNRAPRYPRMKNERNSIKIFGNPQEGEKNRLPPSDARNILTRGRKHGYSKLTFLANNGNVYRAEWYVKFLRTKYDNAETRLIVLSAKNGLPEEKEANWEDIPQIVGLEYDQFLRTVLIAQGSFANFLTAKEEERYQLLEKLVGCEDLFKEISSKIKEKKDEAVKDYGQIAARFTAYEKVVLPEDELATLNENITKLEEEERKAKEELAKVNEALDWYAAEEKFMANIARYQQSFEGAKKSMEAMKPSADRLKLHDSTIEAVTLYKDINTCESNIARQEETLKKLATDVEKSKQTIDCEKKNLATLQKQATDASSKLDRQKPHINKAREIKTQLEESFKRETEKKSAQEEAAKALASAEKAASLNADAIKKAENELKKANDDLQKLTEQIKTESQRLQGEVSRDTNLFASECQKLAGKDITRLQDAKSAAEKKSNDLTNAIRIQTGLKTKQEQKKGNEEKQKQLKDCNEEINKQLETIDLDAIKAELNTLNTSYTLLTSEDWQLHRQRLEEGKPCPLCGAEEHPYHKAENVQPAICQMKKLVDEKQQNLNEHTERQKELLQNRSKNEGELKSLVTILDNLTKETERLGKEWNQMNDCYPDWQEDVGWLSELLKQTGSEKEKATEELDSYNSIVKKVEQLRTAKDTAEHKLAKHNETSALQKEKAEKKKTDADNNLTAEKAQKGILTSQVQEKMVALQTATERHAKAIEELEAKKKELKAEIGDNDPDTFERQLTCAKDAADKKVKEKNEEILKLQGDLKGLQGKTNTTREAKHAEEETRKEKGKSLDSWLSSYNDMRQKEQKLSVDDIARLSASADDWEAIRVQQNECQESFTKALTTLQNEERFHNEHQPKKPETDKEALMQRKAVLDNLPKDELVNAKACLKNHNDAKGKMGDMLERMKEAETLKNDWEEITKAIGSEGKQFRMIAQCYTLRFLIEHANVEIRKFNSRYELQQVKNSLGIRVIDHDRADDVRDTNSLSGGETFIVSLGLALGLSALSSRNISFENLFIDEGFGTLDPDTLATVIDSLAMLQSSQGKKVGVISHTDTMAERIMTQISVNKIGNSGSSRIEIYPEM